MVAALGLFQAVEMLLQRLVRLEGGAVDALQPVPVLVAPPVGARHAEQLERRYPARRLNVGAAAQVLEVAVAVGGDRLVLRDAVNDLHLEVVCRRSWPWRRFASTRGARKSGRAR